MIFADRLKYLRVGAGLTQQQLSEKSGISRPAVASYERGNTLPGAYALCQFADALDVSVDYLLGRSEKK